MRGASMAAAALALLAACTSSDAGDEPEANDGSPYVVDLDAAADELADDLGIDVELIVSDTADAAFAVLEHRDQVTISVSVDAERVVPEVGVGGYTGTNGGVSIWLDPAAPAERVEQWLPGTVAHELHHSSRNRTGARYGLSLGEAMVSEGLADAFAAELLPDDPLPPWVTALDDDELREVWTAAQPVLAVSYHDHPRWFFGAGDLPRWAGYALGFDIVSAYLDADDSRRASSSTAVPAGDVLEGYAP